MSPEMAAGAALARLVRGVRQASGALEAPGIQRSSQPPGLISSRAWGREHGTGLFNTREAPHTPGRVAGSRPPRQGVVRRWRSWEFDQACTRRTRSRDARGIDGVAGCRSTRRSRVSRVSRVKLAAKASAQRRNKKRRHEEPDNETSTGREGGGGVSRDCERLEIENQRDERYAPVRARAARPRCSPPPPPSHTPAPASILPARYNGGGRGGGSGRGGYGGSCKRPRVQQQGGRRQAGRKRVEAAVISSAPHNSAAAVSSSAASSSSSVRAKRGGCNSRDALAAAKRCREERPDSERGAERSRSASA